MELLKPGETLLVGAWQFSEGRSREDAVCRRIEWLVDNHLVRIRTENHGWDTILRDPIDGRCWRLDYPHSDMHGGGPPRLTCIPSASQSDP